MVDAGIIASVPVSDTTVSVVAVILAMDRLVDPPPPPLAASNVIVPAVSLYVAVMLVPATIVAASVSGTASTKSLIVPDDCVPVWLALARSVASVLFAVAPVATPASEAPLRID